MATHMDMVIRIPTVTGRTRITDMLARHSTGPTVTAFIIGITDITGTGVKPRKLKFKDRRVETPAGLLFW
jgi:hypothetical protein